MLIRRCVDQSYRRAIHYLLRNINKLSVITMTVSEEYSIVALERLMRRSEFFVCANNHAMSIRHRVDQSYRRAVYCLLRNINKLSVINSASRQRVQYRTIIVAPAPSNCGGFLVVECCVPCEAEFHVTKIVAPDAFTINIYILFVDQPNFMEPVIFVVTYVPGEFFLYEAFTRL